MPQLAPMPWVTLLLLVFFFKSLILSTLWSHRAPTFSSPNPLLSDSPTSSHSWPWT